MFRLRTCGILVLLPLFFYSCRTYVNHYPELSPAAEQSLVSLGGVARILSELPIGQEHIDEVYRAVCASSSNGYDEEYMMRDLFSCPGSGVGAQARREALESPPFSRPLRTLFEQYFDEYCVKSKSSKSALDYVEELASSDMQIYWPYSESWDGESAPIITFDPGYGASSNYGYRLSFDESGRRVVDSVFVDEALAARHPVWVINRNDDSAYTPLDAFVRSKSEPCEASGAGTPPVRTTKNKCLMIKSFEMLRNYDSWFGGASEFFIKCGGADGFYATSEEEVNLYRPSITDFMLVVKRSELKKVKPVETILLTDFTDQIDRLVFMVTEDDGGERTSWKCAATVKISSRSYGFDVEIPYRDKDDIVWRGQLSSSFFRKSNIVTGRFGEVRITFEII